jgi:hypothetical protein
VLAIVHFLKKCTIASTDPVVLSFTSCAEASSVTGPAGKQPFHGRVNAGKKEIHMGDKSPKSNQKKATQKQSKTNSADQLKRQVAASKQAAKTKK